VFEITSDALGAQNAICGGGRYDLLAKELDGPDTPAVGFAAGMERLLLVMEQQGIRLAEKARLDVFLAPLGEMARKEGLSHLQRIRALGLSAEMDFLGRSIKAQMREANRQNARFVLILGENELDKQKFTVKLMDKGEQIEVPFTNVIEFLKEESKRKID